MPVRMLPAIIIATVFFVACFGDDGDVAPTPRPVTSGPALQIFLREAYNVGLFQAGDPIEITVADMLYNDAARAASEFGLGLYATASGDPPYPNGLPGYLIIAQGEFFDYSGDEERPPADAPRRSAVATAFVDTQGRFTYAWRFTD